MRLSAVVAFCCLCTIAFAADPVHASIRKDTNIPAEGLGAALETLAKDYDFQVLYRTEIVKDRKTQGAVGSLTSDEALTKVLSGTGLSYKYLDVSTVTIVPVAMVTAGATTDQTQTSSNNTQDNSKEAGKKSSQDFRVAQATPGQASGPVAVETGDEQAAAEKKKKAEQLQEVVVTGTHIAGEAPVGTAVHTLDLTEIENSGYTTTQQLLQSLPENFRGGAAGASADSLFSSGPFAGYNLSGGEGVNLRGLGNSATLVLVNGHRVAPSGYGYFTDISTIPVSAVDHIDVLADGSSAIYGSDAVAGVVNIVLKNSSEGVQTGVRYGAATAGGADNYGANAQVGHQWRDGGFTLGVDYSNQGQLYASQRPFSSSFGDPTSLFPAYSQTAVTGDAHQNFGDRFEIHADAQYSDKGVTSYESPGGTLTVLIPDTTDRWGASAGASYHVFDTWAARYDITYGEERDAVHGLLGPDDSPTTPYFKNTIHNELLNQDASISGDSVRLPAGEVKVAIGASYRAEHFSEGNADLLSTPALTSTQSARRTVLAEYAEIRVPIFSESNAIPGIDVLTLSAAVRHDHYSDFGDTTNPKFGLSWFPTSELEFRGAYSTSFRAPSTGAELFSAQQGLQSTVLSAEPGPGGAPPVPVLALDGSVPNLRPETARNFTLGSTYKPHVLPGLTLSATFYDISYSNQITSPPFSADPLNDPALASVITKYPTSAPVQAIVATGIAHGAPFFDETSGAFGPDPLANTVYVWNLETANLASTKTSGFDLSTAYLVTIGLSQLKTSVEVTHIDQYEVKVTPNSPATSEVNSVGNPARTRLRAQEAWTRGDLNVSMALNYVNGYPDTSSPAPRNVAPFTTVDFVVRYHLSNTALPWLDGASAALSVINLFDRLPPYVVSGDVNFSNASHYDPANASPLGRTINLSLGKSW